MTTTGFDFIVLVATSRTFKTTVFSILSANPAATLLLLIVAPDCLAPAAFAAIFTTGDAILADAATVDLAIRLSFAAVLADGCNPFFAATVFFATDAAFFAVTEAGADLAAGFALLFNAALAGLVAGLSGPALFLVSLSATLFKVDSPAALPDAGLVLALAIGLTAVGLPGFLATALFLADFVTVAFIFPILMNCSTH